MQRHLLHKVQFCSNPFCSYHHFLYTSPSRGWGERTLTSSWTRLPPPLFFLYRSHTAVPHRGGGRRRTSSRFHRCSRRPRRTKPREPRHRIAARGAAHATAASVARPSVQRVFAARPRGRGRVSFTRVAQSASPRGAEVGVRASPREWRARAPVKRRRSRRGGVGRTVRFC